MSAVSVLRPDSYTELAYSATSDSNANTPANKPSKSSLFTPETGPATRPSLDAFLEQALAPELSITYSPAQALEALAHVQQSFIIHAQEQPDSALILNRAARVLADELDLRQLIAMYRGALLQG
ncbi:hypothetical protein [Alcaligenes endophyticus]|uniref:Uncharacterized protein n=1 Tax=Alcaligenes endophyticus TaxID=1929088 RepID=A0ABT8EFM5_9BURK|nr:hypothetical protein [Alcaligenes endophyticus]MCX5590265.1 hypothetical protein [Alcaligenes endophyticus]MDN4120071.1 hypothetical protein [Alcaligenes endophyticus]